MNKRSKHRLVTSVTELEVDQEPDEVIEWPRAACENNMLAQMFEIGSIKHTSRVQVPSVRVSFNQDWQVSAPEAIQELARLVSQRQKQEFRINLLEIIVSELKATVNRLECIQTKLAVIGTFAPEPYEVLKPIVVSVHSVESGCNASWFDANIHSSGDNEEEAVSNLKSLILDFIDSFSRESMETLGPLSQRQKAVVDQFVRKSLETTRPI